MIIRYDSTAALREAYQAKGRKSGYGNDNSWYGGETASDSVRLSTTGDTRLVPEAEALLNELDTHIETPRKTWQRSPAGAYGIVPEFLAGIPTHMRRMVSEQDDQAPITILATTTSSGGIGADVLAKRGTVILALVMALSRVRPVTLQQLAFLDGDHEGETIITSTINTSPLDLATACYVLTSAGFARRMTYDLARGLNNFRGGWPRRYKYGNSGPYQEYLKRVLTPDPSKCLLIGAAELHDELLRTPLKWIEKQIAHFTTQDEEQMAW